MESEIVDIKTRKKALVEKNKSLQNTNQLTMIPMAFLSKFLKNHIQFQRNNQTSEIINQPDFLAWNSNSILVLKGVEEELAEDFHFAKKKILDKCDEMHEMFFGTIPFFFVMR